MKLSGLFKLSVAVSVLLSGTNLFATYSGGDGTEANPYQIANMTDWSRLRFFSSHWDKYFILIGDVDFGGATITPVAPDTDSSSFKFQGTMFTGQLDGKGYILKNFIINQPSNDYVGLFGYLGSGGQIKNLGIENGTIAGRSYVGGLCGYNYNSTISNCYATGAVKATEINYSYAGGLCGVNGGTISNCYATGAVRGSYDRVGGLCGVNGGTISNCYAMGAVTGRSYVGGLCGSGGGTITSCYATGVVVGSSWYVGGLCGSNGGTITICYATGAVTGGSAGVGGLCGSDSGTIMSCFWDMETSQQVISDGGVGLTTAQMKTMDYYSVNRWSGSEWILPVGGYPRLAWEQTGGNYITDPVVTLAGSGTVEDPWQIATVQDMVQMSMGNFYWDKHYLLMADLDLTGIVMKRMGYDRSNNFTGSFDGAGHTIANLTLNMTDSDYVGLFGALGYGSQIKNLGVVNASISGNSYVGGLCGENGGIITTCYATGVVTGSAGDVGGLCGYNNSGTLTNCYVAGIVTGSDVDVGGLCGYNKSGTISNCYAAGEVIGNSWHVGGLCGENSISGTITSCYATGAVTGNGGLGDGYYVGGLCGENGGIITTCYATGAVTGYSYVGGLCGENSNYGVITSCYATGVVTGSSSVGGLCGYNFDTITSCYWDMQTSQKTYSSGGKGLTTTQMKDRNSFQSYFWDFEVTDGSAAVWYMPQDGYPALTSYITLTVPEVSGITIFEAKDALLVWPGLNYSITVELTDAVAEGTVLHQNPSAGSQVAAGNTVELVIAVGSQGYGGSGTEADPYRIGSIWDWLKFTFRPEDWSSHVLLTADIDFGLVRITPVAPDTDSSSSDFQGTKFTGQLDGQRHILKNFIIHQPSSDYAGLFGYLDAGGEIKNLGLVNGIITGYNYVGTLCGWNYGMNTSCYATGTVIGNGVYVGGLCGYNKSGTISNCYTTSAVTGRVCVGGLYGENSGAITACYATGMVTGSSKVGGLCGENYSGLIWYSYATGVVTGSSNVGGLCGSSVSGMITSCFWDKETSKMTTSSGGGQGKTTAEMQNMNSFLMADWDFVGETVNGNKDNWQEPYLKPGYPKLAWQRVIPGDLAGDHSVDLADLKKLSHDWLGNDQDYVVAKVHGADGIVDTSELALLANYWLEKPRYEFLVAYWPFDVNGSDAKVFNPATLLNGTVITHQPGEYRIGTGALKLDGIDDMASTGTGSMLTGLSCFSVSMWIKATEIPATKTMQLMGQRDGASHIWSLQIWGSNSGHISGYVGGSTAGALTETTVTPVAGQWYHIAMAYDDFSDRKVHLFVNGVEASTVQQTVLTGTKLSSTTIPVTIGDRVGGGRAFGGNLDDVRIYYKILTPAEIAALASGLNP